MGRISLYSFIHSMLRLLFSPFAFIGNYVVARALWMLFLEISVLVIAYLSIRLANWRTNLWILLFYLIFALFWYHGLRPIINGNAVIVVTLVVVLGFQAIGKKQDVVAGFFLAYATIEPQLVLLLVVFVILWSISHKRWSLIWWFWGWLLFFTVVGMFFIPGWIKQNIWAIIEYPSYTTIRTIGSAFEEWWPGIGTQLKWGLAIFLVGLTVVEWRGSLWERFQPFLVDGLPDSGSQPMGWNRNRSREFHFTLYSHGPDFFDHQGAVEKCWRLDRSGNNDLVVCRVVGVVPEHGGIRLPTPTKFDPVRSYAALCFTRAILGEMVDYSPDPSDPFILIRPSLLLVDLSNYYWHGLPGYVWLIQLKA